MDITTQLLARGEQTEAAHKIFSFSFLVSFGSTKACQATKTPKNKYKKTLASLNLVQIEKEVI